MDIAAHTPDKVEEMLTKFHGLIRSLVATKKDHDRGGSWVLSRRWSGTGDGL